MNNRVDFQQARSAPQPSSRGRRIVVPVLVGLAVLVAYLTPLVTFLAERHAAHPAPLDAAHDVALELKITVADFAKGLVTFHVTPMGGKLMKANGRLSDEVTLDTDPGTGPISHVFKPDVPLTPWVVSVTPDSGDILDYPFDSYLLDLEIGAKSGGKPLTIGTSLEDVPHGYRATLRERLSIAGDTEIQVGVSRTATIIFVALLSTLSLVLVSGAVCLVAWNVARHSRKIEFSMMIWAAALLFVIPTVRSAMPGSVPTGALIDFVIFYWLQIAIAVAMASLVLTWVRRPAS